MTIFAKKGGCNYKFACFSCRYTIKAGRKECLMCHGPMYNVGTKFRTPSKRKEKEWEKLKILYVDSTVFENVYGYTHLGPVHATVREQKEAFVAALKEAFDHHITCGSNNSNPNNRCGPSYVTFKLSKD